MPRKSVEALAGEYWREQHATPPSPPQWLSPTAAKHWREIVSTRSVNYWVPPMNTFLGLLCSHIAVADSLWAEIGKIDVADPKQLRRYRALSLMTARQSAMVSMLLTKLRLLPSRQGTMPQMARSARPPWERHV